jgi:ATP-binding cassette subfamily B protein
MSNASVKERAREAFVRQQDVSECGVACLAAIVRYHGEEIGVDRLWALSDASAEGTTLQGLLEAAEAVGLEAGGYEATLEHLGALESPCILHVTTEGGRDHYVVCYGTVDGKFVIGDPGAGVE